ncbi:MAG: FAD-dependent oxidoreductase [Cyanobacteria bacterium P01_F01_bin.53]
MKTDVLIVGGGLSGLSLARQLQAANVSYHLAEARSRFGGRIATHYVEHQNQTGYFDLGPAWFWPGQLRMAQLIQDLGLTSFLQYADGELSFEDETGQVARGRGYASMEGSFRVKGGLVSLIDGIQQQLNDANLSLNLRITELKHTDLKGTSQEILATGIDADNNTQSITCQRVVLSLPPRVASERIQFSPALSATEIQAMKGIPTWMAGHAKIVAVYEHPFWREAGLSGDAMSRSGPMAEIHDASPEQGGPYALFGFVGVPATARKQNEAALRQAAQAQLGRLFGPEALTPITLILQDWAQEPETATPLDQQPLYTHPAYGLPHALSNLWQGRLMLGSTEVAKNFGGYLEGALEASEMLFNQLIEKAPDVSEL